MPGCRRAHRVAEPVRFRISQLNQYDYAPTDANPAAYNDRRGFRCPIGSHMRRANPRGATIAGNSGSRHRIVRRGVPYGPPYDSSHPDDGIKRGLLGLFIGVSIKDQFEFLMSEWMNGGTFAPGIYGTTDPILGTSSGRKHVRDSSRECRTRRYFPFPSSRHDSRRRLYFPAQHHRHTFHRRSLPAVRG